MNPEDPDQTDDSGKPVRSTPGSPVRVWAWALGTVAGVALLFAYPTSRNQVLGGAAALEPVGDSVTTTTAPPVAASPTASPGTTTPDGTVSQGGSAASPAPASTDAASPAATAESATAAGYTGTVTGAPVQMRYGTVTVQVTFQDGEITAVSGSQSPASRSARAWSTLQSSAVSSQGTNVQMVSGVTLTSQAFAQSLQDAINQAH